LKGSDAFDEKTDLVPATAQAVAFERLERDLGGAARLDIARKFELERVESHLSALIDAVHRQANAVAALGRPDEGALIGHADDHRVVRARRGMKLDRSGENRRIDVEQTARIGSGRRVDA